MFYKIPPHLPLPKGGTIPLFSNPFPVKDRQRGGTCLREAASAKAGGRFSEDMYFQLWTP